MTVSADGLYEYIRLNKQSGTIQFKIRESNQNWNTTYDRDKTASGFNRTDVTNMNNGTTAWGENDGDAWMNICIYYVDNPFYILFYYPNTTLNSSSSPKICAATCLPDNRAITAYFVNSESWNGTIYAFGWYHQDNINGGNNANWPGEATTNTSKTYNGKAIYSYEYQQRYEMAIFNNNSSQTADLNFGLANAGKMWDGDSWETFAFEIALDQQSGSGGTNSVIGEVGSAMPASKTAPTRTGYTFGGYYTETNGSGTCYYNASMVSQTNVTASTPSTLYAKWTKKTYTVTVSNDGHGTTTPSGEQASVAQVDGVAISASANDGYEFVNWTITSGTGSFTSATSASTTFYPTGAATIQANFRSTATNSLTVVAGAGISSVTGSTDPITLGNSYAISATPLAGYTFSTWTADVPANASFASATSASTNVTVSNGSVTVTASATEAKRTLTPTVSYDHGSSDYTATSANMLGVVTTSVLTASTPNAAHYTFAGWTLTNLIVTSGDKDNDLSITVKVDNPASACSAVANYAEVLTSSWYINSDNNSPFTGWGTSGNRMSKKSGHSTEEIYYCTLNITSTQDYGLKMYNDNGAGNKYYQDKNNSGSSKSVDVGSCNGVAFALDNANDKPNMTFKAYLAGEYEFKLDNTGSSPTLTITWPIINQLRISSASPTDATNTGDFDLGAAVSNVRSVTRTLNANTTYTFKIVYNSDWYGYNSGTFTRSTSTSSNSRTLSTSGGDMTITTDYAGDYTFNFNESTKVLSITYPTAYKVTWDVGDLKGNKYTITCKKYNTETAVVSNSTWIKSGDKVTFYAGSNDAANVVKAGYGWKGYYGASDGSGSQLSSLTGYSPAITSNTSIYACFYEVENYVTPYINGQGGMSPNGANCYVETPTSFTANPGTGYYFTGWEQRSGSLTIASPSATTTNVNATAASTLQANFSPRWSVVGTGAFGGWSAFGAHLFTSYAVVSTKDVGYNSITLAANTSYEIKVYDRANSTMYGGSANQDITYATSGSGNEYTIATTSSPKSVFIQSAAGGTYTLNWNLTDKKIAVVYPTSWYITTGVNDALGGSFTAVDNSSNNVYGGKFVANSANVVFTATPNTGYNFSDWYSNSTCTTPYTAGTGVAFSGEGNSVMTLSGITANKTVYAKFTAKTYTVTLTRSGTGYGSGGTASVTATYNQTLPAITLPTAANGYAFMGYYTDEDGEGSQIINASGVVQAVDGYTDADKKWKRDAATELFAYFKQAEITELALDNAMVAPSTTITVTPTIAPTPTGTVAVCYELQYSNGTPLPSQPEFSSAGGYAVRFTAPAASATYKVQAKLCLNNCSGTVLDTEVASFQVAGEHTVTIQYQDADGRTLKASTEITGRPLAWTTAGDIIPPTITGYTFARWDAGDGVTIKNGDSDPVTTTTTSSILIKAVYDGSLTAVYNKKRLIYFYNTLNWSNVYVYFYKNNSYWNNSNGTGADNTYTFTSTPYSEQKHGQMQPLEEGSKIYYFDAEAAGVNASYTTVAFTELNQHGYGYFAKTDDVKNKVIRRDDYKSTTMPMYVPLADQTPTTMNGGLADYYNNGYWMNYPENSGYTLKIYNAWDATKETAAVRSFAFPYSDDLKMPLNLDVEFNEANHDYWFMVYRNDGTYLGSEYHFKQGYQDEQTITDGNNKNKITTSAPGNYTLTLTYHNENYYIDVDFPIANGDYRIYYSDNATWSKGAHTKDNWKHPSHSIAKATTEAKKDTVSFFIPKGVGISHTMKFQKASVTNEGVVSWADVASGSITIPSSVTTSGVYNFIVSQPAGGASISLEKVEPYTGNYYIRTDCAGNTKWDSFKNADHQMTYSDYAENHSGYSHYSAHWVESGNNVSFTIANDYSMCISDTLFEDYGTTIANISNVGVLNSGNASIRFMWNQSTNKISRAYISGSSNISDRFLVLEGDAKMFDENGKALTEAGGGKISGLNDNEMNLVDDQNFVYERTIKLQTTARGRLSAKYNNNTQYFIGSSGAFAEGTTVELLGGATSTTKYSMRIVYDFKTNRLVNAYIPSGSDITDNLAINADIMLVREHQ